MTIRERLSIEPLVPWRRLPALACPLRGGRQMQSDRSAVPWDEVHPLQQVRNQRTPGVPIQQQDQVDVALDDQPQVLSDICGPSDGCKPLNLAMLRLVLTTTTWMIRTCLSRSGVATFVGRRSGLDRMDGKEAWAAQPIKWPLGWRPGGPKPALRTLRPRRTRADARRSHGRGCRRGCSRSHERSCGPSS